MDLTDRESMVCSGYQGADMTHFRPFSYADFLSWMAEVGFQEVDLPNTEEYAFERVIVCKRAEDRPGRFTIRIFSSVDKRSGVTREIGSDAIRILLLDAKRDGPVMSWMVKRTINAHTNVVQRARDAWGYVSLHPEHHCSCGHLMVARKSKGKAFLGCSAFPECKKTKQIA
jgi:hypothetical protein